MTESEFINDCATAYEKLLKLEVTGHCISIETLQQVLDSNALFDIQVSPHSECSVWRESVALLGQMVNRQSLSPSQQTELDERIRSILKAEIASRKKIRDDKIEEDGRVAIPFDDRLLNALLLRVASVNGKNLLFAGLSVVIKDTEQFLSDQNEKTYGETMFREVVDKRRANDARSAPDTRYANVVADNALPSGFAEAALRGDVELALPLTQQIVNKATVSSGRKFFNELMERLKADLCKDYHKHKAAIASVVSAETIGKSILSNGFSTQAIWYPLAVYLSILAVRSGLDIFCEEQQATGSKYAKRGRQGGKSRGKGSQSPR